MNIQTNQPSPASYTYGIESNQKVNKKEGKTTNIFNTITESLRKTLGTVVGKKLAHVKLNKQEKDKFKETKARLGNKLRPISIESKSTVTSGISKKNPAEKTVANLDGILIEPDSKTIDPNAEKKYILVFNGMGDQYEKHLDSLKKLADDTGATVVTFNYRGVGDSKGKANSAKDYIEDGKAFVSYLKEKEGVESKNLLLYGHSLGGGVAAEVGKELEHKGPLVSESSFSTFNEAIKEKKGKLTGWLFQKLGWNFDSSSALETIQQGKLGIIVNRRDPTINYEKASLYKGLKTDTAHKSIHRVKIGSKKYQETLDKSAVKNGEKIIKPRELVETKKFIHELKSAKKQKIDNDTKYLNTLARVKKAGLVKYLRHPHQRIMSSSSESNPKSDTSPEIKFSAKTAKKLKLNDVEKGRLTNDVLKLNAKYAEEDKKAYDGMVKMMQKLLNT